jgi:N-acetylglucosamine-6-phosphate deacetylase
MGMLLLYRMENNIVAYTARFVFTGTNMLQHHAVLVKEGMIESVLPLVSVDEDIVVHNFGESTIAPPFVDIQLYGAAGRLLSEFPDITTLQVIVEEGRKGGTAYSLPTVATHTYDTIFRCVDAIRAYWQQGGKGILGLHVEGPWINKIKRGAHVEELIFTPTVQQVQELLDYGGDVIRMITLAPELCSKELITLIRSYNIVVAAGHSNASYVQANEGFDAGVEAVTHLYNAMSGLQHREPGLVGATFEHEVARASIIPDGYHVDFAAVRIAKKIMGERLFVITDAVTDTSTGPYRHERDGDKYVANGVLSGSALTMDKAVRNLVNHAEIPVAEALRMCSLYPARLLSIIDNRMLLKAGYVAEMVVLDAQLGLSAFLSFPSSDQHRL